MRGRGYPQVQQSLGIVQTHDACMANNEEVKLNV